MARKKGIGSLRSLRSEPSSYSQVLSDERMRIKNEATLKYGGGVGREFLYGFTKGLVGERAASSIATTFRNRGATQRAYSQLTSPQQYSDSGAGTAKTAIPSLSDDSESKILLEKISAKVDDVAVKIQRIDNRLSPKNITIGKGDKQQSFRYDPLAPEGKKVTALTLSGKSGRFASKTESASVLSKAAYLSNESEMPPTAEKVSAETAKKVIQKLREEFSGNAARNLPSEPLTYTQALADEKQTIKAEKTLRYGGKGIGREFLYGFTKGFVGQNAADAIAQKFRNKEQTEDAYQQLIGPTDYSQSSTSMAQSTGTETQVGAAEDRKDFIESEKVEAEQEFRESIIKKLDEILELLEGKSSSDGGGGGLLSSVAGALGLGALGGAAWLGKKAFDRIRGGGPDVPDVDKDKKPGDVDVDKDKKTGDVDVDKSKPSPDKPTTPDTTTPDATTPKKPPTPDKPSGKGIGKVLGGASKALRFAGPIGAAIGVGVTAYDAYQGFNADPNASLGDKFLNAGSTAINSATFGLLGSDADEIAAAATPNAEPYMGVNPEGLTEEQYDLKVKEAEQKQQQNLQLYSPELDEFERLQRQNDAVIDENLSQTQTPAPPVIINNAPPAAAAPQSMPQSSPGPVAVVVRNPEPSYVDEHARWYNNSITHMVS